MIKTEDELEDFDIKQEKECVNKENASKLWKIIQEAGDYLGNRDTLFHIATLNYSSYADNQKFTLSK